MFLKGLIFGIVSEIKVRIALLILFMFSSILLIDKFRFSGISLL